MTEVGKEYGEALFLLAREEGEDAAILDALRAVREIFRVNPEYMELLSAPNIDKRERIDAVRDAFYGNVPDHLCFFLELLTERGHIREYEQCLHQFELCFDEANHHSFAKIYSAVPLKDAEKDALHQKLVSMSGHEVEMYFKIDPALLGGVVVKIDGKRIDGSLRSRITNLKEVMEE